MTKTVAIAGELWPDSAGAWLRVRRMQARLHVWAVDDPGRRFDDLYNLVHRPDFLTVAWERVRGNQGARTVGVDRVVPAAIADAADIVAFLENTLEQLRARTFTPLPVRERMIPKPGSGGKLRRLGILTAMDRSCRPHWCWSYACRELSEGSPSRWRPCPSLEVAA